MSLQTDISVIRSLLAYDADSGVLTWRSDHQGKRTGTEAGCIDGDGYRQLSIMGKKCKAHRVVWALFHNAWPVGVIDHIDGNKLNNRLSNLRDVSIKTNTQNQKRPRVDNKSTSSVPGVCFETGVGKFRVGAKAFGKSVFVGHFSTVAEAEAAALAYRRAHYEGNTL